MAKTEALTVFSAMDDFPEIEPAVDDFPEIAPARENVLKAEKFSPEAFLKSLVEYEETVCAEKGISLRLFEDSRLPSDVIGFAALLRRALYEIIENAISRARTGGTISIHCRADRPSGGIVNLYFTIDDNGADIPERGMQAIFDAGQRAESDTAVLPSLYAAQEAAALMGGSLDARSSAGITRFSLTVAVRVK
jgi:signal transduction histidine kinase